MKRELLNKLINNSITVDEFRHSLKDQTGVQAFDYGNGTCLVKGGTDCINEVMTIEEFEELRQQHQISILIINDD
tara:strand:+ start:79 stop:303 length:225 start_codon:yes stop_codon:yes gene_type:complete